MHAYTETPPYTARSTSFNPYIASYSGCKWERFRKAYSYSACLHAFTCMHEHDKPVTGVLFMSSYRVLVSGQVLSSISYGHGSTRTNDYTLCYVESDGLNSPKKYGLAVKYVSYCTKECPPDHRYCQHSVFVRQIHPVSDPCFINQEAGASASHIQTVRPGRLDRVCGL